MKLFFAELRSAALGFQNYRFSEAQFTYLFVQKYSLIKEQANKNDGNIFPAVTNSWRQPSIGKRIGLGTELGFGS